MVDQTHDFFWETRNSGQIIWKLVCKQRETCAMLDALFIAQFEDLVWKQDIMSILYSVLRDWGSMRILKSFTAILLQATLNTS